MTEEELQDAIHTLYEGDTDTPDSSDDDYLARRRLINAAINRWEQYEGTNWNELRTTLTASDVGLGGEKTTNGTDRDYDCPSDFLHIGGYVRLYTTEGESTYYKVLPVDVVQLLDNQDLNVCYVTGNKKDGFKINFLDVPVTGQTIAYEYYKSADTVSATTHAVEMSDPYFSVYFVVARLFQQDNRPAMAREYFNEAEARLQQMKVRNDMLPAWNADPIPDTDFTMGMGGFGT